MEGLQEYIKRHGNHFTVELAEEASKYLKNKSGNSHKWDASQIKKVIEKRVYYNITNSTLGDIVYLANMAYANYFPKAVSSPSKCIDCALAVVEDIDGYEGMAFSSWITGMQFQGRDFDFTKYV